MKAIEIIQIIMVIVSASYFFTSSYYLCKKMDEDELKISHMILYFLSWLAAFGITSLTFHV